MLLLQQETKAHIDWMDACRPAREARPLTRPPRVPPISTQPVVLAFGSFHPQHLSDCREDATKLHNQQTIKVNAYCTRRREVSQLRRVRLNIFTFFFLLWQRAACCCTRTSPHSRAAIGRGRADPQPSGSEKNHNNLVALSLVPLWRSLDWAEVQTDANDKASERNSTSRPRERAVPRSARMARASRCDEPLRQLVKIIVDALEPDKRSVCSANPVLPLTPLLPTIRPRRCKS